MNPSKALRWVLSTIRAARSPSNGRHWKGMPPAVAEQVVESRQDDLETTVKAIPTGLEDETKHLSLRQIHAVPATRGDRFPRLPGMPRFRHGRAQVRTTVEKPDNGSARWPS